VLIDVGSFAWDGRSPVNAHNRCVVVDCNELPLGPEGVDGTDPMILVHLMASGIHFRRFVDRWVDTILTDQLDLVLFGSQNGTFRSVSVAEVVAKELAATGKYDVIVTHRELHIPSKTINRAVKDDNYYDHTKSV
jgi:hypothetical protein